MQNRIVRALLLSNFSSVGLFVCRAVSFNSTDYWYLNWNLFLAWLPLIFAWILIKRIRTSPWLSWGNIVLTLLWLGFLPNSFYLITDFIHIQNSQGSALLFDIVLLMSFTLSGLMLGYLSVLLVHRQLFKRVRHDAAHAIIAFVFLLCSFAIYLGRYLRWNTWDVLINPAGLLFDVSDRFINPSAYEQTFVTTALFFVFIGITYVTIYQLVIPLLPTQISKTRQKQKIKR